MIFRREIHRWTSNAVLCAIADVAVVIFVSILRIFGMKMGYEFEIMLALLLLNTLFLVISAIQFISLLERNV